MFSDRPITQHPKIDALQHNLKYNTRKYLETFKEVKELTDISGAVGPMVTSRQFYVVFVDGTYAIYTVSFDPEWNVLSADYAAMKKVA